MNYKRNWLIYRIHDAALERMIAAYAHGLLLDVGCGTKPYRMMTEGRVIRHLGTDHPGTLHETSQIDFFGIAYDLAVADSSMDTVLSTVVLEHLERPQSAIDEIARILSPGGTVILSTPLFWRVHEAPRDFFRYTEFGLRYMLNESGLEVVEIVPLSGFVITFAQSLVYYIERFRRTIVGPFVPILQQLIQASAYFLNRVDRSPEFTWAYLAIGRKLKTEA